MNRRHVVGLSGRLAKLRAMSVRELGARLTYRLHLEQERRDHRAGRLADPARLRLALRADLQGVGWESRLLDGRRSMRGRFLPGVDDRERMRTLFNDAYRPEYDATLKHASLARAHRFEFFGQQFTYPNEIDWQADPVTGRRWPAAFHADVPVHGGDVGYGDVKHVWELSRQQYLIDLAKSHFLSGNADDLAAMTALTRSWIAGNPYATGVNWACALEPAFRAWSWLWAYHLTADSLDDAFHLEWLEAFYDHGRFLSRHLEHYSSPYNHLIGEASALYAISLCFPEFRASANWMHLGRGVLEGRLDEQFYRDGGSVEQSTFYHHATVGFYVLAALLGRVHRQDLSQSVWNAIERGLTFSMRLTQPDGRTPAIGGADDGKPIRMEHLPFWDFRPYLAIGAVLFKRGDFKAVAGRCQEDAVWLLGPEAVKAFEDVPPERPDPSVALRESGYFVMRTGWSPRADYVCVDCGEQAAGMRPDSVPNSMHGHADCLSVIVWLNGQPVLVDSGLFAYNCGGAWEAHFRETAAHNTARIDRRNQARHIGKMAWSNSYRPAVEGWMSDERQAWVLGSHDGFARGPDGVVHRRAVWLRPGGYVLVYDRFTGTGDHDIEVNYQFAPGALTAAGAENAGDPMLPALTSLARFDERVDIACAATGVWTHQIRCGGDGPDEGWICPSLGVRTPAPRLTLNGRLLNTDTSLLTIVADSSRVTIKHLRHEPEGAGTGILAVTTQGHTEWISAAGITRSPAIDTDALVAIYTVNGAGATTYETIGGTYFRGDPAALGPRIV